MSFWEGVKRLSAEKLLRIIREYDHGKNCYPFEKVAFQVKSKEELSAKVEKYLKDDEDNLFVVEYEGAGAYALTSPYAEHMRGQGWSCLPLALSSLFILIIILYFFPKKKKKMKHTKNLSLN